MTVRSTRSASWMTTTVIAVILGLAGCSSDGPTVEGLDPTPTTDASSPSSTSPTPSRTQSPAEREAVERSNVEQAWLGYWETLSLLTSEDPGIPESEWLEVMSQYAVEDAARQNVAAFQDQRRQGLVSYGRDDHRLSWEVDIADGDVAQIWDCQDNSQSGLVAVETGEKVTVGRANDRVEGQLVRAADGSWRVQEIVYHTGDPC